MKFDFDLSNQTSFEKTLIRIGRRVAFAIFEVMD
jgi:hypothetical protein